MKGFGLFQKDAVNEVAGHTAFLEGVVDRMRDERDTARAALVESEAARANLEAAIREALGWVLPESVQDSRDCGPVYSETAVHEAREILSRAGDPVVLREHDAKVWDEAARAAWGDDESLWPFPNPYREDTE